MKSLGNVGLCRLQACQHRVVDGFQQLAFEEKWTFRCWVLVGHVHILIGLEVLKGEVGAVFIFKHQVKGSTIGDDRRVKVLGERQQVFTVSSKSCVTPLTIVELDAIVEEARDMPRAFVIGRPSSIGVSPFKRNAWTNSNWWFTKMGRCTVQELTAWWSPPKWKFLLAFLRVISCTGKLSFLRWSKYLQKGP